MNRSQIQFSTNWNNKLSCKYFTTTRLASPKYQIGNTFDIFLKDKFQFTAKVIESRLIDLNTLDEYKARLDTGYSKPETVKMLRTMYKNKVNLDTAMFCYLLLEKMEPEIN